MLGNQQSIHASESMKAYYERKFKREESNINRTNGVITYVVHPSRALSGRKEEIENKNSVLRFFFPHNFSALGLLFMQLGVRKLAIHFFFSTYQKRITSFRPPNPHKQKSQCTRLVEKKNSITKSSHS